MEKGIGKLQSGVALTTAESFELQTSILQGNVPELELIEMFEIFEKRFITAEEFLGFVQASRDAMVKIETNGACLDTCGTGGDLLDTFNISTVSAIVLAACGVLVAKHGNRSSSSKCGSADVLEEVGVKIGLTAEQAKNCLEGVGVVFLFAPKFHPAFKHVGPARKAYGKRTYFNFMGPLLNPALARFQVTGVSDVRYIPLMGKALMESGSERVWLLQSQDRLDEISPCAPTTVYEFSKIGMNQFILDPKEYGMVGGSLQDIQIGTKEESAEVFMKVLESKGNQIQMNAVVLNVAAGLVVSGKVKEFQEGIEMAREALKWGKAFQKFEGCRDFTNK